MFENQMFTSLLSLNLSLRYASSSSPESCKKSKKHDPNSLTIEREKSKSSSSSPRTPVLNRNISALNVKDKNYQSFYTFYTANNQETVLKKSSDFSKNLSNDILKFGLYFTKLGKKRLKSTPVYQRIDSVINLDDKLEFFSATENESKYDKNSTFIKFL